MEPKKSLSQNYLTDPNIARKITASLTCIDAARVVEIGSGHGMLTKFLAEHYFERLYLVEIDNGSVQKLNEQFPRLKKRIIHADILTFPMEKILIPHTLLTGNLPYHITSPIFFRLLDFKDQIDQAVFMIQKEVAERICSPHGKKSYGLLSVLLQTYYRTEYLFTVSEHVFYPRPKVKSAVIRLTRNDREELPCDEILYHQIIKKVFGQRRKMLRNSMGIMARQVQMHPEFLRRRPEQMSVADFIALCSELGKD
ncbi:MAG: ribosomal RNA small subunit methyltransferase A [Chlorobi bacterium]|nr:ribosomal RNA small subunit methyltransferase A [Chlorobiota bacterium]